MTRLSTIASVCLLCVLAMDVGAQILPLFGSPQWSASLLVSLNGFAFFGLVLIATRFRWAADVPKVGLRAIQFFWVISLITFTRGAFNAQDYWDWRSLLLLYLPSALISVTVAAGVRHDALPALLRLLVRRVFPLAFPLLFLLPSDAGTAFARAVMPVSMVLLFVFYFRTTPALIVGVTAITSAMADLTYRANALRIGASFLALGLSYWVVATRPRLRTVAFASLCVTPIVLLVLGATGTFNVFSGISFDPDTFSLLPVTADPSTMAVDTRTFLYQEITQSMMRRDSSFLIGEGGASGYDTEWFADLVMNERGRYRAEVGFLNTLLNSGAIGVLSYAFVLLTAAYFGLFRSRNRAGRLLGLYLAFRWPLFFVEDVAQFDLNFFSIWLALGLCLSSSFRALTDSEIKALVAKT